MCHRSLKTQVEIALAIMNQFMKSSTIAVHQCCHGIKILFVRKKFAFHSTISWFKIPSPKMIDKISIKISVHPNFHSNNESQQKRLKRASVWQLFQIQIQPRFLYLSLLFTFNFSLLAMRFQWNFVHAYRCPYLWQ